MSRTFRLLAPVPKIYPNAASYNHPTIPIDANNNITWKQQSNLKLHMWVRFYGI